MTGSQSQPVGEPEKHLERELNHIQTLVNTHHQAKKQIVDPYLRDLTFQGDEALGWW